jgi:hypothetical protein
MAAATMSRISNSTILDYTPSELIILGKKIARELNSINFKPGDILRLQGNKFEINFLHEGKNQILHQITGTNFTFTTFLAIGKNSGDVVVTHERNKLALQRSLLPMTEKLLKGVIDNLSSYTYERGVEQQPIVKVKTEAIKPLTQIELKPLKQIELKPLTELKLIEPELKKGKMTIAQEVNKKSEALTDFSKELMVTAEVTFESKPNKKHYPKEEYKIKVFGQDNNKKFKEDVQKDASLTIKKIANIIKYFVIGVTIYAVYSYIKEHYIK